MVGIPSPASRGRSPALVWPRLTWWRELVTVGVAYLVYESVRAVVVSRTAPAIAHGRDLLRWERWAHLDPEVPLNHFLNRWDPLSDAAGYYYSTLHFVVTPLVLIYLWRRHPDIYPRLRSSLVVATTAGLVVFIAWPAAPPRFTTPGLTDTLVQHDIMGMSGGHGVSGLIDQYAAMPSLHVGWAIWCAAAVTMMSRSRWRHLAWAYPALTTFVVLATANHYLLDGIAGAALVLIAMAVMPPSPGSTGWPPIVDLLDRRQPIGVDSQTSTLERSIDGRSQPGVLERPTTPQ